MKLRIISHKKTKSNVGCEYFKTKHGYTSGCGYVAAYNKFWHYCPYCGKPIITFSKKYYEN